MDPAGNQIFGWPGPENFAGASGASSGSQSVNLNNKSFTIAAWVRPTAGDTTRRGILGRNSGQNNAFPYLLTEGRKLKFGFGTGSSLVELTASDGINTDLLNLNQWNFVAVRYNLTGGSVTFFVGDKKFNSSATNATPNSAFSSFFIGRASNLGKLTLGQFAISCEGDFGSEGEYDIIGSGENLARKVGNTGPSSPLNITRTFNESYNLTICEDDDNVANSCAPGDEFMGNIDLDTNQASIPFFTTTFANPSDATECAYNWAMADWPDLVTLDFQFENDSIPFQGEIRGIEIHAAALAERSSSILPRRATHWGTSSSTSLMVQLSSRTRMVSIGWSVIRTRAAVPAPALPGTFLTATRFDGVNDYLTDDQSVAAADKLLADLAGNNNGYTIRFFIKPSPPVNPSKPRPVYTIYDSNNNIRMQLALVHAGNGYRLRVIDNYQVLYAPELCNTIQPYDQMDTDRGRCAEGSATVLGDLCW